jgi:hypothetical protein
MDVEIRSFAIDSVTEDLLVHCAALFSEHYGVWGSSAPATLQGRRIRMTAARLRKDLLFNEQCCLVVAYVKGELVGHVFFTRFPYERVRGEMEKKSSEGIGTEICPCSGTIVWITQLVVHSGHRQRHVATTLIKRAFDRENDVAAGIVTSHPYAVRAFERATGHLVVPNTVSISDVDNLLSASQVPYLQQRRAYIWSGQCTLETGFYADHTEVNRLLSEASDWHLGNLKEGEEFLAIVFSDRATGLLRERSILETLVAFVVVFLFRLWRH